MTELFEDNQRDLERAVENLGFSLEQNIDHESIAKLRQDITNQSVRTVVLLVLVLQADLRRMYRNVMRFFWTIP